MKFWFFMLASVFLLPIVMIISGRMMWKHCPKEINYWIGYRTTRSTKNLETWKFANEYYGHLYEKIGWTTLIIPALVMLPFMHRSESIIGKVGTVVCLLQCIVLILPIFPTERALKKNFFEDGTRR